jgi:hypothetical protein
MAPIGGGPLGRRGNSWQRATRSARVRTVVGGVGSLMSGRARGARGPAGEGNGVGRAQMNSDDFQLFKPISNELK